MSAKIGLMRGWARGSGVASMALALLIAVPLSAQAEARKAPSKGKAANAKPRCEEAERVYFQQLPPAPIWPAYEAMQIELTQGKGEACNLRMVVTGKESYELLSYRAVCRKSRSIYRCHGLEGSGSLWFDLAGRGAQRHMTLRLPDPGLSLTGLANRALRERLRTPRGTITVELQITRDSTADTRS